MTKCMPATISRQTFIHWMLATIIRELTWLSTSNSDFLTLFADVTYTLSLPVLEELPPDTPCSCELSLRNDDNQGEMNFSWKFHAGTQKFLFNFQLLCAMRVILLWSRTPKQPWGPIGQDKVANMIWCGSYCITSSVKIRSIKVSSAKNLVFNNRQVFGLD